MDAAIIEKFLRNFLETSDGNYVSEGDAIRPDLVSMRMYDDVLLGVASPLDGLFERFGERDVVGPHFMRPVEWLSGAASVISVFFTFTEEVIKSNAVDSKWPSDEWLHARIEGQTFINRAMNELKDELKKRGHDAVVPSTDSRFDRVNKPEDGKWLGQSYTSNWSERHVAFACGLGTLGLSAGLITKRGMAGRLGSLVTSLKLEPTPREYVEPFEYCTRCGVCVKKCPAHAISLEAGKNHFLCSNLIDESKIKFAPRLGCGKCQVAVPCQSQAPGRLARK